MQLDAKKFVQSPLNYTGGKYRLLPQILPLFPDDINVFVDLFCGGCNVGINAFAKRHIYNDYSTHLINLYSVMKKMQADDFISRIERIIEQYSLSDVSKNGYEFYGCNSSTGLSGYNKDNYLKLRNYVNCKKVYDDEYYICLYVLIVYAFNNQIRFNKHGEFNLPVGKRDFNNRIRKKLERFISIIHEQNACFYNKDYYEFSFDDLCEKDFVYVDPPYLITCASYNEQGAWDEDDERMLLCLLDSISQKNIKFALSNVIESKGKVNNILLEWINNRPYYNMIELDYTYGNSNYQRKQKNSRTREVLVINY